MSRRRSRRCGSSRAPARSSIRTTSHVAISASSNSPTRTHVGDPVSRRYSTQAEVSMRIIYAPAHFVEIAVPPGSAHLAGFIEAQWLRCKRAQGKIDGFPLGREAVLPHDRCTSFVVDIHVGACHTPIIHHNGARCSRAAAVLVAFQCCCIAAAEIQNAVGLACANTAPERASQPSRCARDRKGLPTLTWLGWRYDGPVTSRSGRAGSSFLAGSTCGWPVQVTRPELA